MMSWFNTALKWGKGIKVPGGAMVSGSASAAGIGAVAGAGYGAYDRNTSVLGGAAMGALAGVGVPSALKYGGMGVKKAGMSGLASKWGGAARGGNNPSINWGLSEGMASGMMSFGNRMTGVGSNFNSVLSSGFKKASTWAGEHSKTGWTGVKKVAGTGAMYGGGGAALGLGGWLAADIANYGGGVNSVRPTTPMQAAMGGAMWGLGAAVGIKGLGLGAKGVHSVAGSKFMASKNMKMFQGGLNKTAAFTQKVADSGLIKGALTVAAVSSGVKMTKPVNR
jgi:hypothetical protein